MDPRERARKRGAERNASSWFKLREGDNGFRILPTPESKKTPGIWFEYMVHRDIGPKKQMVRCGHAPSSEDSDDSNTSCWLCDTQIPKVKVKHEARAAAMVPKEVFVIQVAKVDEDGKMQGPLVFSPSTGVANQILTSILGSKKRDYTHPTKGYNVSLSRTGTGKTDTRYGMIEPDEDQSSVPPELISKLKPFSELQEIPPYSEAKQKAAYQGVDAIIDDEDDDEEEELVSQPRKRTVVDDDEDDDDDEDKAPKKPVKAAEPDDEDDEPPVKVGPTKKPKVRVIDEDAEEAEDNLPVKPKKSTKVVEPDDDEDDEPAPPKKGKPVPVEEDEDDEPPIKAVAKKNGKAVIPEDDDDEDIDDLDDEDEDDAPPIKTKKKK